MRLHHLCIQTNCFEASLAFYRDALGLRVVQDTEGFHGRAHNAWLEGDGFFIELQTGKGGKPLAEAGEECCGLAHFCLWVEDIGAVYGALRLKGVRGFLPHGGGDIYEVNGGRLFKLRAPEGTVVEFRDKIGC